MTFLKTHPVQSVVSENDGNNLVIDIVPINDPVGPAGTVEDLDCIVISEETKAGGAYVNKIRLERGLGELAIHEIPLIQGESKIMEGEDDKISSSSIRLRKLGTLLKPVLKTNNQHSPYILGLTGGSCSGKSSVCQRFVKLGAKIIDCDKLGHQAYSAFKSLCEKGTQNRKNAKNKLKKFEKGQNGVKMS